MKAPEYPTLLEYIRKLMAPFEEQGFHLTPKARDCLLRAIADARAANVFACDDSLLRGFIEARSIAIPILDSAGVKFRRLLNDLKDNPDGYDHNVADHFLHEYQTDMKGGQPFRVVQLAVAIAQTRGRKIIDSSILLEGLFRQSLDGEYATPPEKLAQQAKQPLHQQIKNALAQANEINFSTSSLSEVLEYIYEKVPGGFVSPLIEKLTEHIGEWRAIEQIEEGLAFARHIEPYIEEPRHIILPTPKGYRFRQFDYFNSYFVSDGKKQSPSKINIFTGPGIFTWGQIEEFEHLINKDNLDEKDFQRFFEKNPIFLLGGEYRKLHSQVTLFDGSDNELIPDFFAEHIGGNFADIIEIKKPTAKLIVGKHNRRGVSVSCCTTIQ